MEVRFHSKAITYAVAMISIVLYMAKLTAITYIAFNCCLGFKNSNNVFTYSIAVSLFSILKLYLFQSVLVERTSNVCTWQICSLLEITMSLQFGFCTLLNHQWFQCINQGVASSLFICLVLDTMIYGYFAFRIVGANLQNRTQCEEARATQNHTLEPESQDRIEIQGTEKRENKIIYSEVYYNWVT